MRKRFLSTVLVLIMLLSLAPMSALADDTFRSGDFTFVIETGVACVKKIQRFVVIRERTVES